VNRRARQLLPLLLLTACGGAAPHVSLMSASGARPLDAWYAIFIEPLEGPGGMTDAEIVVAFVDPGWGCTSDDPADLEAISFAFPTLAADPTSITVLSRSGPILGPTTGGSGEVRLSAIDARYQGEGATGPLVGMGGHVSGDAYFDLGNNLMLTGDFTAPHCATLDFRNAP
jgi:hypothetical protein